MNAYLSPKVMKQSLLALTIALSSTAVFASAEGYTDASFAGERWAEAAVGYANPTTLASAAGYTDASFTGERWADAAVGYAEPMTLAWNSIADEQMRSVTRTGHLDWNKMRNVYVFKPTALDWNSIASEQVRSVMRTGRLDWNKVMNVSKSHPQTVVVAGIS